MVRRQNGGLFGDGGTKLNGYYLHTNILVVFNVH